METAGIFILPDHLAGDFLVLVGDDAFGSGQKADEGIVGMGPFGCFEDSGDDIVASRRRPPGKDDAEAAGMLLQGVAGNDLEQGVCTDKRQLLPGRFQNFQRITL